METLSDGTRIRVRPSRLDGGPKLRAALHALSPQSRYQRFLSPKDDLTPAEMDYLTRTDGIRHLALAAIPLDADGAERDPIGVARWIREAEGGDVAEVAVTVADAWQRRGVGALLFRALALRAQAIGVRRWRAVFLTDNRGVQRLLEGVGRKVSETRLGAGQTEAVYELRPPPVRP
ncbi:MAG: GNAT family N-acetyltransferase [Armatimonadota bacterium]|nr:GNAT family N-acetyltransferase [Armatimonadota bacterium]